MKLFDKTQMYYFLSETLKYLGIEANSTSKTEKVISGIGAMLGILLCQLVTLQYFDSNESLLLIASMGATATLIYALPHGALSQPWSVFGGHFTSAIIGILSYQYIPESLIASSVAVGGAVLVMYFLRCLHPPGGATALFCTQGGDTVHALGFNFLIEPLLQNVIILIGVAVLFNGLFSWRRYPAHLNFRHVKSQSPSVLSHEDLSAALLQSDSFVDVSTEELAIIFDRAMTHANTNNTYKKLPLKQACFYSNGALGEGWNIREIINISNSTVTYKVVFGKDKGVIDECSQRNFRKWARFEVEYVQGSWIKTI
ncbi:HPP family protein [Thalassotalea piscium]|uniref:CBS-domain-containing membrane protein n=1 Tax=Thalassotalea piscium TaxID=1230533 RepID=A0A7X0TS01_9GAMM|nr:HPP family protein [Thalassotalea piscium]MBB6541622.1 CBS-domain-containing membrane protein [Thalassotalea piscium]